MEVKRAVERQHKYLFSTKGLLEDDYLYISEILRRYGAKVIYKTGDYSFLTINELINHCKEEQCSSFLAHGTLANEAIRFSLIIGGSFSMWEVGNPIDSSPAEAAISGQTFHEIKSILRQRVGAIPGLPWHVGRNALVLLPAILLLSTVLFPSLALETTSILQVTLSVAFIHYTWAWLERSRWNQSILVKRSTLASRLARMWPDALLIIFGAALGPIFTFLLELITQKY